MANIFKQALNKALKTKVAVETAGATVVSEGLKKTIGDNPVSKGIDSAKEGANKVIDRVTKRHGGYVKGNSVQPSYKHGDCPKAKAN